MKVSDSLDNVPNENVVTQLVTNQQSDQLLELLEWLFATKNKHIKIPTIEAGFSFLHVYLYSSCACVDISVL